MNVVTLTEQILQKMSGIGKVRSRFFVNLVSQWLRLRGRYCFENMVRQGFLNAMSYRRHFSKFFDFAKFNHLLIEQSCSDELIICFDPSYISKAGKHTQGVGKFWSGCSQSMKWGLEIASLPIGDVKNHTAFHRAGGPVLCDSNYCQRRSESNGFLYLLYQAVCHEVTKAIQIHCGRRILR